VIVQTGASALDYAGLAHLAALALDMAAEASVPVVVHLRMLISICQSYQRLGENVTHLIALFLHA
jgi:fructose/tagatose bisphosphate aldolase